ncbi:MAG: alginate export family protein [Tannerella sp.]|jgi:hypothetical protein|nr:alginate export family protein [Tannerella sp.]
MRKILFLLISLASFVFVFAQEKNDAVKENEFTVDAQIRTRAEYRNGALNPRLENQLPASFINDRARFSIGYKRSNLQMKLSAQQVGVWGQSPQVDRAGNGYMLNEAWARLNFSYGFFAQLGRQLLVYDDERILGALDWNTSGRSHDALKLGWEQDANKLHLILAFNQNDEKALGGSYYAAGGQPYKTMQSLWYGYKTKDNPFDFSALLLNLGLEGGDAATFKSKVFNIQTLGANVGYAPSKWKIAASLYFQTGKTVADASISAFMASISANGSLTDKFGLKAGLDYLSGDNQENASYQAFNPLYGTHHKFYGSMDYFYANAFKSGLNPGLVDPYIGINLKTAKSATLSANYHYFMIANDVLNATTNENIKKGLGSEIDLQFDCTLMKNVSLTIGYSTMFGTASMDYVKGGNHKSWQDWGWISLNINPQILFVKW